MPVIYLRWDLYLRRDYPNIALFAANISSATFDMHLCAQIDLCGQEMQCLFVDCRLQQCCLLSILNMIRTIGQLVCKKAALRATSTIFHLSWHRNASFSIQDPLEQSPITSPTTSLVDEDQQQPLSQNRSSSASRLIPKIQDFLSQVAKGTLIEQIPYLVDICTQLKHRNEPVKHQEYSALFSMKHKVRFDQISTLQITQLQSLLHYYLILRKINVVRSNVDLDSALYNQYTKLLLTDGEMCLPIFKVAEMELLFAELTHIRPNELTKLYTYLVNSVFTTDFQGVELQTMLTLLLALFKHNKRTQPQRDLVGRLLQLLKGGYSLLTTKDKIKLVLFVLRYDLEQQYTVYINGQVDILQQFLNDLKNKTISLNDQQVYQTLLPICQYISAKQKKEIENLLISHFFQNIDVVQGSKPIFSVKSGIDIISSYSKGRKFKEIDPVYKQKILGFFKRGFRMQHQFFYFMNIMVMLSNLIFMDFFEDNLDVVQDLKNAIGKRRIGIKLINELSRVGIKVEPFYFQLEENRYEKRKSLANCSRNAINHEISLLLAYKKQEEIQPDEVYFSDLAQLKYNQFLELFEGNFTAFLGAMFITHNYTLQQFGNAFNLVEFILSMPLDKMDLNINKKRKLMNMLLNCTRNYEICFKGLPIYHYIGPDEFNGIIKKDRVVYFNMILSPLVLETALHLLSRIIAFRKEKYYKKLLQSLFEVMTAYTKVLLLESPAGKVHSYEYQAYWQVLYLMVDNCKRLKQAEGEFFKFKSLLREVLQATGNISCCSQEMDTFLKKCMAALFDEKEVGFLLRKVVLKAIYARLINSQNCLDLIPKIQMQDIMTPELQTFLECLQNKQCSDDKARKSFLFDIMRSNGNLSTTKLSDIYKFFKYCERNNIFIKVLCLFDLQVNSSNARLFFYIVEQLDKQNHITVCRKYNIIAIIANIRKYLAAYDPHSTEYKERYQFVGHFLQTLLNSFVILFREMPIGYLCELLLAVKELQVRNLVLQQKLLNCLSLPYQSLWGSLAIIKYLVQVGHKFSAGELEDIERWVIVPSNKKKLREWKAAALKDNQQLCINVSDLSLNMQFDATFLQIISGVDASILSSQPQNKLNLWNNWQRFVLWKLPNRIMLIVQFRDKLDIQILLQKINGLKTNQNITVSQTKLQQRSTNINRQQIADTLNLPQSTQSETELIDYLYFLFHHETVNDFQQKYQFRENQIKRKSPNHAYRDRLQPQQEEL